MAVFKTPSDWENDQTGEELYDFFKTDIDRHNFNKKKTKNKNKKQNSDSSLHLSKKSKLIQKIKKLNYIKRSNEKQCQPLIDKTSEETRKRSSKLTTKLMKKKRSMSESSDDVKPLLKKFKNKTDNINSGEKNVKKKDIKKHNKENGKQNKDTDNLTEQSKSKKRKKKKKKGLNDSSGSLESLPIKGNNVIEERELKKRKRQLEKLKILVLEKTDIPSSSVKPKEKPVLTLRQKMLSKLKAARFRFLNEQIYTTTSKEAARIFKTDPESFKAYHEGYKQQVKRWPLNPLDVIIKSINKMPKTHVISDFGCGEARLASTVNQTVHSFDFVAVNDSVTACDMAHVPLDDFSVDVAVFCLSLMGTNLREYLLEANRVLKNGGILKIAEVESRFEDVNVFVKCCEQFGFKKIWMDLSHNLFYFIDFKKEATVKGKKKLPQLSLLPCLYKKR